MAPSSKAHACNVGPIRYRTLSLVILFGYLMNYSVRDNLDVLSSAKTFSFAIRQDTRV